LIDLLKVIEEILLGFMPVFFCPTEKNWGVVRGDFVPGVYARVDFCPGGFNLHSGALHPCSHDSYAADLDTGLTGYGIPRDR